MKSEITKKYYKIREVSELIGVAQSTLRYWESEFPQVKPHRNEKGTRFYTSSDIETLRQIKFLLHDRGLKTDAAREQLHYAVDTVASRQKALERLRQIRATLVSMRDALHRLR